MTRTNTPAAKVTPATPAAPKVDPWAVTPADATAVSIPATAPRPKGSTAAPLSQVLANPVGHMMRNRASGSQGTGGIASLSEGHVRLLAAGGTVTADDGSTVTFAPLPLGVVAFAIGHTARNEPGARGDALYAAVAVWATGRMAAVRATDAAALHPVTGTAPHTVRAVALMAAAPLPEGFTPAVALSTARGAAALYKRVQDRA